MNNTYDMFFGPELQIAEKMLQRRAQMLVHSCLYYEMNITLIEDATWDKWARELKQLQEDYPEISKEVRWYEYFADWDATTGAFLPLKDEWVIRKAQQISGVKIKADKPKKVEPVKVSAKSGRKSLF